MKGRRQTMSALAAIAGSVALSALGANFLLGTYVLPDSEFRRYCQPPESDSSAVASEPGLASSPNVYLVPVGRDYMRSPFGTSRKTLVYKVIDEVMPIPSQAFPT